jgi:hypothetical protein
MNSRCRWGVVCAWMFFVFNQTVGTAQTSEQEVSTFDGTFRPSRQLESRRHISRQYFPFPMPQTCSNSRMATSFAFGSQERVRENPM